MIARGVNAAHQTLRLEPEVTVELSWFGLTDVGHRRETNQDSYLTVPPIFAVADGMGGHAAGEVASAAVVRRLAELGGDREIAPIDIDAALHQAVLDMELESAEAELGTGTTVTGLTLGCDDERPVWRVFNIGDSRVYQYLRGSLVQLTLDHSVVQHLIDTGQITPEEAETHPHANVITRAVGLGEDPLPDYGLATVVPGQRLLLCSDGLTKELTDVGIQHFLAVSDTAEDAARALMHHALDNAGRDNVTIVVIDVHAVGDLRDTAEIATVAAGGSGDAGGTDNAGHTDDTGDDDTGDTGSTDDE